MNEPLQPFSPTMAIKHAVHRILSELEHQGKGRRVSKTSWPDDRFWHIVDVSEHPRSTSAVHNSDPGDQATQVDDEVDDTRSDINQPPKLPSVFAIKFYSGVPTTGRVMKIKQIFRKEWRLLPHN